MLGQKLIGCCHTPYLFKVQSGEKHWAARLRALVVGGAVLIRVPPLRELTPALPIQIGTGSSESISRQVTGRSPAHTSAMPLRPTKSHKTVRFLPPRSQHPPCEATSSTEAPLGPGHCGGPQSRSRPSSGVRREGRSSEVGFGGLSRER